MKTYDFFFRSLISAVELNDLTDSADDGDTDVNVGGRIITTDLSKFRSSRDSLDWDDFQWLREIWPRKFFIKGVLHADDARSGGER